MRSKKKIALNFILQNRREQNDCGVKQDNCSYLLYSFYAALCLPPAGIFQAEKIPEKCLFEGYNVISQITGRFRRMAVEIKIK